MKKLLELLGMINLSVIVTSNVISCDMNLDETELQDDLVELIEDNSHSPTFEPQRTSIKVNSKQKKDEASLQETIVESKPANTVEKQTLDTTKPTTSHITTIQTNPTVQKPIATMPSMQKNKVEKSIVTNTAQSQITQSRTITSSTTIRSQINPTYFFEDNNNNDYFVTDEGLYVSIQKNEQLVKINNTKDGNIWHVAFDSKNNMYFAAYDAGYDSSNYGELYVIKNNTITAVKIEDINRRVHNITIDNNDNVYLDTDNGLCVLKQNQTNVNLLVLTNTGEFIEARMWKEGEDEDAPWKRRFMDLKGNEIKEIVYYRKTLGFDTNNNLYFTTLNETHVLKDLNSKSMKIDNLDGEIKSITSNQNNVYFVTKLGAYVLKQNETTASKIEVPGWPGKANYIIIHNDRIYIGCLHGTHILDFNHRIIKSLWFDSLLLQFDNQGNIYFGSGRGLYKFKIATNTYEKIKINKNGRLIESDDEIKAIYFVKNQVYFEEYTRQGNNFYRITTNNTSEPVDKSVIYT